MPGNKCNEEIKQGQRTGSDKRLFWDRWSGKAWWKRSHLKTDLNEQRKEAVQVSKRRVFRQREEQKKGE